MSFATLLPTHPISGDPPGTPHSQHPEQFFNLQSRPLLDPVYEQIKQYQSQYQYLGNPTVYFPLLFLSLQKH